MEGKNTDAMGDGGEEHGRDGRWEEHGRDGCRDVVELSQLSVLL